MALPSQVLQIPLGGTTSQKTARLTRGLPVLRHIHNAQQSSEGEQVKRRGFTRLDTGATVYEETPEAVYVAVGIDRDCLFVVGMGEILGVVANANTVNGSALVRRGPSMVGNYRTGTVKVSALRRPDAS